MDNSLICFVYSMQMVIHLMRIIFFLVIMLIEVKCHWKPSSFSFVTKSNMRKISFSYVEIMNVHPSIVFMDFMMKLNDVTVSNYGKHLPIVSIVYRYPQSLMKRFSVVMVDLVQICIPSNRYDGSLDQRMCLIQAYFVISYGPIQIKKH